MDILVVGGGAVGSWLGAALAAGGADVTVVARGDRARQIAKSGLVWRPAGPARTTGAEAVLGVSVAPTVAAAARPGHRYDAVAVAVKSYHTRDVAAELQAVPPSCVISFQNGVGNETTLARILSDRPILPATITAAVAVEGAGTVVSSRRGGVGLSGTPWPPRYPARGAPSPDHGHETKPLVAQMSAYLAAAGVPVGSYPDGASMKWSKLLLNLVGAATSAVLRWPRSRILADGRLYQIERLAWFETLAVLRGLGHRPLALPGYPVNLLAPLVRVVPARIVAAVAARMADPAGDHRLPGTARDLAMGRRRCEVEVLNGAVVRAARDLGLPVPWNEALVAAVQRVTSGPGPFDIYRGRPELLAADIDAWAAGH